MKDTQVVEAAANDGPDSELEDLETCFRCVLPNLARALRLSR